VHRAVKNDTVSTPHVATHESLTSQNDYKDETWKSHSDWQFVQVMRGYNNNNKNNNNLEITACNVECVRLDSVFSDAELWMCQETVDKFTDMTTDKLRQSFQFFTTKLQDMTSIKFIKPIS